MSEIILSSEAWKDVEEGTEALVEEWLVKPGDSVTSGQVVATVVVVKTSHDVTASDTGVVESILVQAEETFKPGQVLATVKA
jgi:pyruvate/2-oxoglutarate dehydrogenase complex dihydrolipoamide acyltransferase (E2) component